MSNLIDRDKAIEAIEAKEANEYGNYREYNTAFNDGLRSAVFALEELPSAESVRRETYEQVRWERDTALEQLKELGYSLGEKPRKSDLISRQDAIEALTESNLKRHMDSVKGGQENRSAIRIIMGLPSAERKGKWTYYDIARFRCSECGKIQGGDRNSDLKFCSNCGARMEGEEE